MPKKQTSKGFKEIPLVASADVTKKKIPRPVVATAPIKRTDALYFTIDGGTFDQGEIRGSFCPTVGGAAMIVNIEHDETGDVREVYEVSVQDVVAAILESRKASK